LEHFSLEDGARLSSEVCRVLKSGGVFRVVVPDAGRVVRSYVEDPAALVAYRGGDTASVTAMEVVNLFFRQRYEHQFLYDWETIRKMLLCAGFQRVERSSAGHAQLCKEIVLDDQKYAWESLYAEATKS
jgi:predicted SAM-dependent methyltransferase